MVSVLNDPDHASPDHVLYVQWPSSREHFYLFIKSALVGSFLVICLLRFEAIARIDCWPHSLGWAAVTIVLRRY